VRDNDSEKKCEVEKDEDTKAVAPANNVLMPAQFNIPSFDRRDASLRFISLFRTSWLLPSQPPLPCAVRSYLLRFVSYVAAIRIRIEILSEICVQNIFLH
jgi:hypothetical protein